MSPVTTPPLPSADEVYEKVHALIINEVKRYLHFYGGDYQELMSEANLAFVHAYRTFRPATENTGQYHIGGWVQFVVRHRLLSYRRELARSSRLKTVALDDTKSNLLAVSRTRFDRDALMTTVSEDARTVLACVMGPLSMAPQNHRRAALVQFLLEMGWAATRIRESFSEIKQALQS